MRKIITACCFIMLSNVAYSEEIMFMNADESPLGELCIAAVDSMKTMTFLAKELGISPSKAKTIQCNGQSLRNFVRQYRQINEHAETVYVFNVGDEAPETKLCFAALTSEFLYEEVKQAYFPNIDVDKELKCNGMSVDKFVARYKEQMRRRPSTASL